VQLRIETQVHSQLADIRPREWNALVPNRHPFLRHELLRALEDNACVGARRGWLPCHIGAYLGGALAGAMPLYEKYNSYGELVFDHAWADAYERMGLTYFPKLVNAVPYTPATGPRLLAREEHGEAIYDTLLRAALVHAEERGASSLHCLFPNRKQHAWLSRRGLLARHDCQYHWHNPGYRDFDDFLSRLSAKKRKNIRQERRRVREAGVTLRRLDGHTAGDEDWRRFAAFYAALFEEKWGIPTLNFGFFRDVARALPSQTLLVLADRGGRCIAGALLYRSDTTLYGRHWGCTEQVDGLHFETCYYQGIEHCIEHGIRVFEPGAQGEHKIARGFVPILTRSSHWIPDSSPLKPAIARFAEHERAATADYMRSLEAHGAYKRG
jgi:predicted N-acyltransferase